MRLKFYIKLVCTKTLWLFLFCSLAIFTNSAEAQTLEVQVRNISKADSAYLNKRVGFFEEYFKVYTGKLINEKFQLNGTITSESLIPEDAQFGIYRYEANDYETIRQAMALKGLLASISEVYKKTPISKKIEKIEKKISKYFVTEVSQGLYEEDASVILPGEMTEDYRHEEKVYSMALSSFFSPDETSLKVDFSVNLKMQYLKNVATTEYSFLKENISFTYTNSNFNELIKSDVLFLTIIEKDNEVLNIVRINHRF